MTGKCKHCGDLIERLKFFDDGRGQWVHVTDSWLSCPTMPNSHAEPEDSTDEH